MWQTNKKIIILLIISVCVLLALGATDWYLYQFIQKESASIKSAGTAIAILEDKERDLASAKNSVEEKKKDIEKINEAFLTEDSFVTFLKLLEKIAGQSGVVFQAERATLPSSANGRAELNFTIHGNYAGITNFFSLFDQVPYAGIVDQVSIMPDGIGKKTLFARAHFIIFNFLPPQ